MAFKVFNQRTEKNLIMSCPIDIRNKNMNDLKIEDKFLKRVEYNFKIVCIFSRYQEIGDRREGRGERIREKGERQEESGEGRKGSGKKRAEIGERREQRR